MRLLDLEGADVGAAALALLPGVLEALAAVAVLDGDGGVGADVLDQRRVEGVLVAALLVVVAVQAARLDLGPAGAQLGAALALALAGVNRDRGRLDLEDVLEQVAALPLGQLH